MTVEALPGITDCHHVRVRSSGSSVFVDVHVLMDGSLTLEKAHGMTETIERAVQAILPGCDITIHPEPDKKAAS